MTLKSGITYFLNGLLTFYISYQSHIGETSRKGFNPPLEKYKSTLFISNHFMRN